MELHIKKIAVIQRKSHVSSVPFSRSVCARITEAFEYLASLGKITWSSIDEHEAGERAFSDVDVIVFNKHLSDESLKVARMARAFNIPTIYDIDDWLLGFPSYSGAVMDQKKCDNFREHMKLATIVTVANHRIKELLQDVRQELVDVPNGFWIEKYMRSEPTFTVDGVRFVFTNADNLKVNHFKEGFLRALKYVLEKYPNAQFDFFGDSDVEMMSVKHRMNYLGSVGYDMHKIKMRDKGYSFAIVPLGGQEEPDSLLFNSCKNPFKYLEYGGLGIPAIFSRSPIYEDAIDHGINGLLVNNTEDDWCSAFDLYMTDTKKVMNMARAAYDDVKRNHHIRYSAEKFLEVINSITQ